jgi:hypothetical protein
VAVCGERLCVLRVVDSVGVNVAATVRVVRVWRRWLCGVDVEAAMDYDRR